MAGDQDVEVEVVPSLTAAPERRSDEDAPLAGLAVAVALLALGVSSLAVLYVLYRAKSEGVAEASG